MKETNVNRNYIQRYVTFDDPSQIRQTTTVALFAMLFIIIECFFIVKRNINWMNRKAEDYYLINTFIKVHEKISRRKSRPKIRSKRIITRFLVEKEI